MVSTVVTTVAFMKSMVLLYKNIAAHPIATHTMIDQKICLNPGTNFSLLASVNFQQTFIINLIRLEEYSRKAEMLDPSPLNLN